MTPADKREVCAILRRVLIAPDWWTELDRIEKEIESCSGSDSLSEQSPPSQHVSESSLGTSTSIRRGGDEPCPTTEPKPSGASVAVESGKLPMATPSIAGATSAERADTAPPDLDYEMAKDPESYQRFPQIVDETSGASAADTHCTQINGVLSKSSSTSETPKLPLGGMTAAATSHAPPDLDAIRKAIQRLAVAPMPTRECSDSRELDDARRALLNLDVPAVVERLADRIVQLKAVADGWRFKYDIADRKVRSCESIHSKDWIDSEVASRVPDAVAHLKQRAEAAEARASNINMKWAEHSKILNAEVCDLGRRALRAEQERDAARKERDDARAEKAEADLRRRQ